MSALEDAVRKHKRRIAQDVLASLVQAGVEGQRHATSSLIDQLLKAVLTGVRVAQDPTLPQLLSRYHRERGWDLALLAAVLVRVAGAMRTAILQETGNRRVATLACQGIDRAVAE